MLRYLPAGMEVLGLILMVAGCFLIHPALGVLGGGAAAVLIGYFLEGVQK